MIKIGLSLVHEKKSKESTISGTYLVYDFKNVIVDQLFDTFFIKNKNLFAFESLKFHCIDSDVLFI